MSDFETYRPLLFSIAYRMLGSAMEAEDIVQEAYLRYQAARDVQTPKAYLTTIVTRLCLDQLKSAREQREQYIGPWLPEPVLTGGDGAALLQPAQHLTVYDSISMAFLVLLEHLNPVERAVFLLREVFDYGYDEIGQIIDRDEAACRQIFHRARQHLDAQRPRYTSTPEAHRALLDRFLRVIDEGDLDGLMQLLADDVTVWSDGGGKASAAAKPVVGRDLVARFVLGLRRAAGEGYRIEVREINGSLGVILYFYDELASVLTVETDSARVRALRFVRNPDKLKGLRL